jgi:hypothetical protein
VCTVVLLIRPNHEWPVLLAANRDERLDRPWDPPGLHWPEHPGLVAGRDRTAGGTWMGLNRAGVVATVLNRQGTLGPAPGKRSRGELPLIALARHTAADAARAIAALDSAQWRSFNMVIADRESAIFVRGLGHGPPQPVPLGPGLYMVTAHDPNDLASPRVARHLPRFRAADPPVPGEWEKWGALLADQGGGPGEQINIPERAGYGTSSSSLLALSASGRAVWLFAAGPPDRTPFEPVPLPV